MGVDDDASLRRQLANTVAATPITPIERPRDPEQIATALDHGTPTSGPRAEVEGFPVPGWDRYEPIRLLGQGGMGRVFLARDLRLHRNVAIKFVRGDDGDLASRILAEARAQARVNDDRVCKVFDVGEIAGRVYIAMQFVDGRPLTELTDVLTYEQKALVLRGAALGVHEAHRAGLIHRDLKPSNIMVEQDADGALRPFVMDFGVARDWTEGNTLTGTVIGTPQYMAPEQARGEVKQLDRRADVYSLGATLYALLTDHAPIEGANPLVVINRLALDEPARPRSHDPDVPADLDAIVMKCLEKERTARYDSARALADDLGRFLDGAPVAARASAGLGYRLRKTARRSWRLLATAAVVLAIVAIALSVAVRERRTAARRAALARGFTERVVRIEALARYSALAPPHDLRADRAELRALMAQLSGEIRAGGALAQGPGHYALGRGHLALGDDDLALAELQAAWARGLHDPRAAYALALAEGRLYQRELHDLDRLPAAARDQRRPALEHRYRDPARDHLRAAAGTEVPSRAYVAALLAYYDGRYDDALRELDGIASSSAALSWFYEAPLLRGQVLHARAWANRSEASAAELDGQLDASRRAFDAATEIGRSDPALQLAIANFEYTVFGLELYGRGQVDEPYRRGMAAIDRALVLTPDAAEPLALRARFERGLAESRSRRGEDAAEPMARALADAERAVQLAPTDLDARLELSRCYRQQGALLQGASQDPGAALARAVALVDGIAPADRTDQVLTHLGLTHKIWADYLDQIGGDASGHRQLAIDAYAQALARSDGDHRTWTNLGSNYYERARHADLAAPGADDDLARAADAFARSRALQPHSIVPDFYAGEVHALRARRQQARGADPEPERVEAIASYQHGLTINADEPNLYNGISIVEKERAHDAVARGEDPSAILDRAEAAARGAIAAAPAQGFGYNNLAAALIVRAQATAARGGDLRPVARAAAEALDLALTRIPDHPEHLRNGVLLYLLVAQFERAHHRDARPALARARDYLERARALDPTDADTRSLAADVDAFDGR